MIGGPPCPQPKKHYQTITLSHIFMISLPPCTVPLFSLSWISFVPTIRFQCPTPPPPPRPTPDVPKTRLQLHWDCFSSSGCLVCVFGVPDLDFLGHHIDRHGITHLHEKVQTIRDFPKPQSQHQLRLFIGLVNFYHRFLHHCTELMRIHYTLFSQKQSPSLSFSHGLTPQWLLSSPLRKY